ncbi:CBY1-interacting BAR domain-containing protein 1 [Rhincodon typus]|uniref:CBY1-interacting BAR domain-containing protein 1 n=1 Tax=Rhincodon typus TaxID=259920 RepID=UPI0009A45E6D|nr:CBY1-interacting BAR domain-containing protein 1 [Rhincodon typus]
MFQARDQDTRARDSQTKYIHSTVVNVEKHFGEICTLFAAYARKTARLRDKSDLLVKELREYSDTETPNLKYGLSSFADHFALVQDYRHAEVERLEAKVVEPMKKYGSITKLKKEDLKVASGAIKRESRQIAHVERMRQRNPSDRQIVTQAESELQRVTMDATRIARQLEETIDDFQEEKIRDIKKIFGDFITIEMAFHAKALEVYSKAYQHIQNIDEEADMEIFRNTLHLQDSQPRLSIVSANSINTMNGLNSALRMSGSSKHHSTLCKKKMKDDDDEEEEEEEEEEDDDEDDEEDD